MDIDNARELKSSLLGSVTASLAKPTAVRSLGIRTQESHPGKDALRTMAIGITTKGKEHKIAIRLQRRALEDPTTSGRRRFCKVAGVSSF
jgi:hypothetical protein